MEETAKLSYDKEVILPPPPHHHCPVTAVKQQTAFGEKQQHNCQVMLQTWKQSPT